MGNRKLIENVCPGRRIYRCVRGNGDVDIPVFDISGIIFFMLYRGGIFLFAVFIMILSDKITSKKITKVSYKTRSLRGNSILKNNKTKN